MHIGREISYSVSSDETERFLVKKQSHEMCSKCYISIYSELCIINITLMYAYRKRKTDFFEVFFSDSSMRTDFLFVKSGILM